MTGGCPLRLNRRLRGRSPQEREEGWLGIRMDRELHIEVSGYRISVSRLNPEPVPSAPGPRVHRSLESSTSSFELVDPSPASQAYLAPSSSDSPYPLQASGPRGSAADLPSDRQLPARPQVRSLFSSPSALGSPPQAARSGSAQAERCVEAAEPPASSVLHASLPPPAVRSVLSSPLRVPEYPLPGPLRPRSEVEADFPPLPVPLRDTCKALRGGSIPWQARALRAWTAGCWTRAVLEAQVESPNHSEQIGLSNRIYCICIIAARGLASPTFVRTFAAYKAIVGELRRGGSVSHAFPSEAEARLYFAGAGLDFPEA